MPAVDQATLKELYNRLDESIQLSSKEDLAVCTRMLALELAYLKVRHTVLTQQIPGDLQNLSPAQMQKVLSEAYQEFSLVLAQAREKDEKIIPLKSKLQS